MVNVPVTPDESNEPPEPPSTAQSVLDSNRAEAPAYPLPSRLPRVAVQQLPGNDDERKAAFASIDSTEKLTKVSPLTRTLTGDTSTTATNTLVGFGPEYIASRPYAYLPEFVAENLKTNLYDGLDSVEAARRLAANGPNRLEAEGGVSIMGVLLRQVSNSLTLVLVIAMCLAYGTSDFIEGGVITAVILLNIVVGFVQDYKAEKTMKSLQNLSAPIASALRDGGKICKVKAEDLVVGDIVRLSVGDVVPADLRLFEGMNFETNEALLTGEALSIVKSPLVTLSDTPLDLRIDERINMAFSSSTVAKGRATGIVVAAGMKTEVGNIAALLNGKEAETATGPVGKFLSKLKKGTKNVLGLIGTPLQVKLSKFAILLFFFAIALAIIVFSANKWKIDNDVLIYGICVAVAVIPESLIAVLTITMSVGTKTMAKGNVVVRKMQSLEAVGGVTNICSDKTGTLTQGKMIARTAEIENFGEISVHGTDNPFDPTSGSVKLGENEADPSVLNENPNVSEFLDAVALCNLAVVRDSSTDLELVTSSTSTQASSNISEKRPGPSSWTAIGEPTEISLQVFAMRFGHGKPSLTEGEGAPWTLLTEHPFDSSIKRMSVVLDKNDRTRWAFMKGAAEVIIPTLNIPDEKKTALMEKVEQMASGGLRVLCIANKKLDSTNDGQKRAEVEQNMDYLGLVGLYDPPRNETRGAVRKCQIAGVKVHMLTGDHIRTATAIAHEVGILPKTISSHQAKTLVMTAAEFDAMSEEDVDAMEQLPLVIARCSPTTKVRVVEALHRRGAFCVMTGDGVNDSPALKRADVGIAMGLNGSDVAKDASDMVLTDDNFASIVQAVEEGRRLFDNIQKFIVHLLISNISQVVLLISALGFRDNRDVSVFPLSPLEILWVNMITSSFLALGLGLEEASPDIMLRPPHDLRAGVFTWEVITDKMIYGVTMGGLCLFAFATVIFMAGDSDLGSYCNKEFTQGCADVYRARATVFAVLSFLLLVTAWEVKHFSRSIFNLDPTRHKGPFSVFRAVYYNKFLFWAVVAGFVITFPVIYIPGANRVVFHHTAITWEWGVVWGCVVIYLVVVETWKAIKRYFGIWSGGLKLITPEEAERRLESGWE